MSKFFPKLRWLTWFGLITVAAALIYCNFFGLTFGSAQSIATTSGWPFIYWTETTSIEVNPGMPATIEIEKHIQWAAILFNLLAATALLAATGLTIERFLRPGATQFSLSSAFTLITLVAIAFGLRAIEPVLFGHGAWSSPGTNHDRDLYEHVAPPLPVRVILFLSIAATLLQAVRSAVGLAWFALKPMNRRSRSL